MAKEEVGIRVLAVAHGGRQGSCAARTANPPRGIVPDCKGGYVRVQFFSAFILAISFFLLGFRWANLRVDGGLSYVGYSASGIDARRPGGLGKFDITPSLLLFNDAVKLWADAHWRSDEKKFRQPQTRVVINPKWAWGSFYLYDFTPEFTQYTLSGTKIRGAGVDIYSGGFKLFVVYGKAKRATVNSGENASFTREIWGVKVGGGREESSHLYLTFLDVNDKEKTLPQERVYRDTISTDSITVIPPESTITTTPKNGVNVSLDGKVSLWKQKVLLSGEVATALYTRDKRAGDIKGFEIPGWARNIIDVNFSTHYDYAYNVNSDFAFGPVGLKASYYRLGPGYISLGLASFIPDKTGFETELRLRFLKGRLGFKGGFKSEHDNLLDQKIYTTTKTQPSLSFYTSFKNININLNLSRLTYSNDSPNETTKVDNRSLNTGATISNIVQIGTSRKLRNSLSFNFSNSQDKNGLRAQNETQNYRIALHTALDLTPSYSFLAGYSFTRTDFVRQNLKSDINGITLGAKWSPMKKLVFSPTVGFNLSDNLSSTIINISSNYKLAKYFTLFGELKGNLVNSKISTVKDFREWTGECGINLKF